MPEDRKDPSSDTGAETRERLYKFLHDVEAITLGTVAPDGSPHTSILYFACDPQLCLYFYSDPNTAHCRHIEREPRIAVTAIDARDPWEAGTGLQMHGRCEPVGPEDAGHIASLYDQKYPEGSWGKQQTATFLNGRFYRVTPTWARWMNRWRGSGHRFELTWPENETG